MKKRELSSVQKSILMLEKYHGDSNINSIVSSLTFDRIIDYDIINNAYNIAVMKNDLMRTIYIENNEIECIQVPYKKYYMKVIDLRKNTKEEIDEYIKLQVSKKIDISKEVISGEIIYLPGNKTMLLNKAHHIVGDAWSIVSIQSNNMVEIVYKLLEGQEIDEKKYISPPYDVLINREKEYKKSDKYSIDKEYFKELLKDGAKCSNIKNRKIGQRNYSDRITEYINESEYEEIKKYCKENRISEYTLILTALTVYLYRILQRPDILIGTPILNRLTREEKETQGLFVSALPLRFRFEEDIDFLSLAKEISSQMFSSYRHIKFPYAEIIEEYYKVSEEKKMFDVSLSYQNATYNGAIAEHNVECEWYCNGYQQETLVIHVLSLAEQNKLKIHYDYLTDLMSNEEIYYLHRRLLNIISEGIKINSKVKDIDIISKEEKDKLAKYTSTSCSFKVNNKGSIISEFEKMVSKYPDKFAIKHSDDEITYLQLSRKVNALAIELRKKGVERNQIVAIKLRRGINQIVAILAVLKAGGAYMPMHMDWPEDRILYMLEDSKAVAVITTKNYISDFAIIDEYNNNILGESHIIDIEDFLDNLNVREYENLNNISKNEDLAYIIYTSGTTGNPKGTLITNKNVLTLFKSIPYPIDISEKDIWSMFHSYTFDVSVWEIFGALLFGGTLVIIPHEAILNTEKYVEILKKEKVTIFNQTSSMLYNVIEADKLSDNKLSARYITIGGERLYTTRLKEFKEKYKDTHILVAYGMTETAVVTSFYEIKDEDLIKDTNKIGKSLPFKDVNIVDKNNKELPMEVEGELCETGPAVSNGYISNDSLTAEKFINIFSKKYKTYKSGDIAKIKIDGNIEYIGRKDTQVKIRGYRIELEEIEKAIFKIKGINKVVVIVKDHRIIAFIEKESNGNKITRKNIKEKLSQLLPLYMLPEIYIIDKIPNNINGKVDKTKLLKLIKDSKNNKEIIMPNTKAEKEIIAIFKRETTENEIGITDEFSQMNIDSLEILKISLELRKLGYIVTPQDIYNHKNIKELACNIIKENNKDNDTKLSKIDNINVPSNRCNMKNILLTGATGFFGVNILQELISNSMVEKVYCIVRDSRDIRAKEKLENQFNKFFKDKKNEYKSKVVCITGDITKENLGLDKEKYSYLQKEITTIINSAASTKYYGEYNKKYKTNTLSVKHIIDFAKEYNISICHISTLSVAGFVRKNEDNKIFNENTLDVNQSFLDNIYMLTKYQAEELLLKAQNESNLNIKIFRLGNLMPRMDNGLFQKNERDNTFMNIMSSFVKSKYIAEEVKNMEFDITPVDIAAKAVCVLMEKDNKTSIYHIANKYIKADNIIDLIGKEKNIVPLEKYLKKINDEENSLIEIIITKNLLSIFKIKNADSTKTIEMLNTFGIEWKEVDKDYINKIVKIVERW